MSSLTPPARHSVPSILQGERSAPAVRKGIRPGLTIVRNESPTPMAGRAARGSSPIDGKPACARALRGHWARRRIAGWSNASNGYAASCSLAVEARASSTGRKPRRKSAALLACDAARTMARLSSRSTSSQEPI